MIKCIESLSSFKEPLYEKLTENGEHLGYFSKRSDGVRVIYDKNTGLYWEVKSDCENDVNYCLDKYNFDDAQNVYLKKLNDKAYGGFDDWRIPNKDELRSIIDYSLEYIAIDTDVFENCVIGDYWTKNTYNMQDYFGWVIYSGFGSATAKSKNTNHYVIACRGGKYKLFGEPDENRFKDNGDGTVTDSVTGIMWQKGENERMDLESAEKYCSNMDLAGYNDWRLPNIKELNTILNLDYKDNWWYFKNVFPAEGLNPPLLHYFSSSSFKGDYAWVTNFCFGYDGYYGSKNAQLLFRACRTDENSSKEKEFKLPHTGQKTVFDVEGNITYSQEYEGLDYSRVTNEMNISVICGGNAAYDENTGLTWYIDKNMSGNKYTWEESKLYVDELNKSKYCGFDDWRLPYREELRTIVNYNDIIPAVDKNVFNDTLAEFYWSAQENKKEKNKAWGIYFGYGCAISYLKETKAMVRAVRGNNIFENPEKRFADNGDGTVTDTYLNIMWLKEETPLLTLKEAIKYCKELKAAGYDDWYLPNIKELGTIINIDGEEDIWHYGKLFPNTNTKPQGFYLSSTTFDGTFGWGCNFQFGFDGYYADRKNGRYPFRPARRSTKPL